MSIDMAQIPNPVWSVTVAEAKAFLENTLKEFADQGRVDNSGTIIAALQMLLDDIPDGMKLFEIRQMLGDQ